MTSGTVVCSKCGERSSVGDRVCIACGARLSYSSSPQAPGVSSKAGRKAPDIGKLAAKRDYGGLRETLEHPDETVSAAAAQALSELGDESAFAILADAIGSPISAVRRLALSTLDTAGWEPDRTEGGARYLAAKQRWDECVDIGEEAIKPLTDALRTDQTRGPAVDALVKIGASEPQSMVGIFEYAHDCQWKERLESLTEVIGRIGDPVVEPLITSVDSKFGKSTLWRKETLLRYLKSIAKTGTPGAKALVGYIQRRAGSWSTDWSEIEAALALSTMGRTAIDVLVPAVRSEHPVRAGVVVALSRCGMDAAEPLVAAIHSDGITPSACLLLDESLPMRIGMRRYIPAALAEDWIMQEFEAEARKEHAEAGLWSPPVRPAATRHLQSVLAFSRRMGPALMALITALSSQESVDYEQAADSALMRVQEQTRSAVMAVLAEGKTDTYHHARRAALRFADLAEDQAVCDQVRAAVLESVLVRIRSGEVVLFGSGENWGPKQAVKDLVDLGESAVGRLIAALSDDDKHIRRYSAQALGQIGDRRAAEPLETSLQDPDRAVRKAAEEALKLLGRP
jgi:hypothetical protein